MSQIDLPNIPECVRQYLLATGVVDRQRFETVFLKQRGLFNIKKEKWIRITAQQSIDVKNCGFVWKAKAGPFQVIDQLVNGAGSLVIRLFGIIGLKKFQGKEIDQGEISRFLAEMIWYPTAFTEDYIEWIELGEKEAEATIDCHNTGRVSIQFNFDNNHLIKSIAGKRYREQDGSFSLENWLITALVYRKFNSIMIPYKAQVSWEIDGVIRPYYKLEITEVEIQPWAQ